MLCYIRLLFLLALAGLTPWTPAFAQTKDYDSEDNGYIDITTLAQLNAIRWDLDGNGTVADSDTTNYYAAFDSAATGMGCPGTGCIGYELKASLDFDEDTDGRITATGDPTYWDSGNGWVPIGTSTDSFTAVFKGNNNSIFSLFINRGTTDNVGLFGTVSSSARIDSLNLIGFNIVGRDNVGCLIGSNNGSISACSVVDSVKNNIGVYSATDTVAVSYSLTGHDNVGGLIGSNNGSIFACSVERCNIEAGGDAVGGLIGSNSDTVVVSYSDSRVRGWYSEGVGGLIGNNSGTVIASYAGSYSGAVVVRDTVSTNLSSRIGGLIGNNSGTVTASYSAAFVSGNTFVYSGVISRDTLTAITIDTTTATQVGGLIGNNSGTVTASYWDTEISGQASSAAGTGKTTTQLQSPTSATVDYATWDDLTIDDSGTNDDDPWNFGTNTQYPVLDFGGLSPDRQFANQPIDYDTDDDGLIEIKTVGQLWAMDYDENGSGIVDDIHLHISNPIIVARMEGNYRQHFPRASSRMGCPSAGCRGYELLNDLTFDTNGDGSVSALDHKYGWYDGYGWLPIDQYSAIFHGNGHTISHLFINRPNQGEVGLFSKLIAGRIDSLNLTHARVIGENNVGALLGYNYGGSVTACSATGTGVRGEHLVKGESSVGGLIGTNQGGTITKSYVVGSVKSSLTYRPPRGGTIVVGSHVGSNTTYVGGLVGYNQDGTISSSYARGDVINDGLVVINAGYGTSVVYNWGLADVGGSYVGGLVGYNEGWESKIIASYANSNVSSRQGYHVGGLAGYNIDGTVVASYATGSIQVVGSNIGGLIGTNSFGTVTASYSTSLVFAPTTLKLIPLGAGGGPPYWRAGEYVGGLIGEDDTGTIKDSYWDTRYSGIPDDDDNVMPEGRPPSDLILPTDYTGIYSNWDVDLNDEMGNDDPWDFGSNRQYPVLQYDFTQAQINAQKLGQKKLTLVLSPSSIAENAGVSTVTATLSASLSAALTVTVSVTPVSPAVEDDYTLSGTTLVFAANTTASTGTVTITAADNNAYLGHRAVSVKGTVEGGSNEVADAFNTLIIREDETLPTATLSLSPMLIAENAGVSTVTATLSAPLGAPLEITVAATPVGTDYTLSATNTLTIAADSLTSMGTVTITAMNNNDSGDKSVTVSGTAVSNLGVADPADVTLTIKDDETLSPTLILSPASIGENGGISTVTATLFQAASAAVTIVVSPAVGGEYTISANDTLTIAALMTESTGTVTITAVNNTVHSGNKEVTVSGTSFSSSSVPTVVNPSGVTLTITEDEALPTVTLALSSSAIDESGTANVSTVTATLSGESSEAVTVTVVATPVSPADADDFSLSSSATLTIAADSLTSMGTVTIRANNNSMFEMDKSVTVSGTVAGGNGIAAPEAVMLTITEDDAVEPTLILSPDEISEDSGMSTVTATLAQATTAAVTIVVSHAPVSPAVGGDYTFSANDTLTIATGATTSTGTVTITAVNNTVHSGNKEVTVSGTSSSSVSVANPDDETLTIADDEGLPTATLVLSPSVIDESGSSNISTVTATLSFASSDTLTIAVSVDTLTITALGDTLTAPSGSYTLSSPATLTIAANMTESTGTVTITAVDDGDQSESKILTVSGTTAGGTGVADPEDVTLTIRDDETVRPTLVLSPASISETSGESKVTATLNQTTTAAVTITVSPAVGGDYTLSSPSTLTIAANATTTTDTVTITAVGNNRHSGDRSVTVLGVATSSVTVVDTIDATLTITDDEALPIVTLALSSLSIEENGGVSTVTATLSGASSDTVTIAISAMAGTNANRDDFSLGQNTLIIAPDSLTSTGTVTITARDNSMFEPNKIVTVSGRVTGGNGIANPSDVELTITEDDGGKPMLILSPASIGEAGGMSTVTATLDRATTAAITITVSAEVSSDYTFSSSTTLTIAADSLTSMGTVTITANDNDVDSPNNEVTVSGTVESSNAGVDNPDDVTLTITDDEILPTVTLVLSPQEINESGTDTVSTVTATLSGASSDTVTIVVSPVPVSPADANDYTFSATNTLTIAANMTASTGTVTITAVNDNDVTGSKEVTVSGTATGGNDVADPDPMTLTIRDDETVTATLDLSSEEISEAGGVSTVTATLNRATTAPVTITVSHTPESPDDYSLSTTNTLTIATGATTSMGTVTITAVDNDVHSGDKSVTVSGIATGNIAALANPANVTLTITEDEALPRVTLGLSSRSIGENGGVSTVTATLSGASSEAVTVTVAVAPVLPAVTGDYSLSSSITLTIDASATASTGAVTITALDNDVLSSNKRVTVSGTVAGGNGVADPSPVTLTITEDDGVTPTLTLSSEEISEAGGVSTVTATLDRTATEAVIITVSVEPVSPAVTGDYSLSTANTLTIAANATASTGAVTITAVDNDVHSPDKSVTVSGTVAGAAGVADPSPVTLTITNDDAAETSEPEPDPDTDPVFTDALDPQNYRQGTEIAPLTLPAATGGNGTLTYSLTDLPEGLTFDAETLVVSGTPTEAIEKTVYTLTAIDEDEDSTEMNFFLTVLANLAPSFDDASVDAQAYMRKQEIEAVTLPEATGGDGTLTYALAPDLPEGLTFDAETRMLSGTPLEAIDETAYTLMATDADGDEATLMFTLEVMADLIPTFGDTTTAIAARGYQHQAFAPLTLPQATGGDGTLTYALTPDLPEGLTFNAETRMLSGTPVKAMDAMTYTLTATDSNGDAVRLMFTLEVPDLVPTFGGDTTIVAQSYLVNHPIEPLTLPQATSGDGTLAYILLPFLPDGLAFDPETRVLSGTPVAEKDETTYTLTAFDVDGDIASLTFTLDVQMPSSDFDGNGQVNFADFLTFAGKFGTRRGEDRYDARFDLDGDGEIGFSDFLIFAANFGSVG